MQSTSRNIATTPPTDALLAGSILDEYRDLLSADHGLHANKKPTGDCQTCGDPTCHDSGGANSLTDCQTCGDPTCHGSDGANNLTDCQTCGDPTCHGSDGPNNLTDCQTCGDPTCHGSDGPKKDKVDCQTCGDPTCHDSGGSQHPHHPPHKKTAGWIDLPRM